MNSIRFFAALAIAGSIITIASCKKNHDVVAKPDIITQNTVDTLTIGDTLSLHPVVTGDATKSTFVWAIGSQSVGTDSLLAYIPTTRGDYQLVYTVTNPGGSSSITYKI